MASTYREIIYIILDELKIQSDDSSFNEEHVVFLINKYRAFLLKQRYADVRKEISDVNFQSVDFSLILVPAISGTDDFGEFLRTTITIPSIVNLHGLIGITDVTSPNYWDGDFTIVNRDRFRYVANNKWLKNFVYCSISPDNYMYFKAINPQFKYIESVKITSIFENPREILLLNEPTLDPLELEFPLEASYIPPLVELCLKELLGANYKPEDNKNNAKDDLSEVQVK